MSSTAVNAMNQSAGSTVRVLVPSVQITALCKYWSSTHREYSDENCPSVLACTAVHGNRVRHLVHEAQFVPTCFPLFDGCLSISAACRSRPVIYLFRVVMFPMSLVLIWFWWLNRRQMADFECSSAVYRQSVFLLSTTGSVFLVLYVGFLGTDGPVYDFLRRLGIYVFFGATGIAQLMTTLAWRQAANPETAKRSVNLAWRGQCVIVLILLCVGPLNLILKEVLSDANRVENVIEWNFALLMFSWYGLQAIVFQGVSRNLKFVHTSQ